MYKVFLALAILFGFISSAYASQDCYVNGYAAIFFKSGEVAGKITFTDAKFYTRTETWQDCYNFAIKKSKEVKPTYQFPMSKELLDEASVSVDEFSLDDIKGAKSDALTVFADISVYFTWEFNDGYFDDSDGQVTSYTDQYIKVPELGNLNFLPDGSIFSPPTMYLKVTFDSVKK